MIEYLILILAVPLGFLLANTTKDEKEIYSKPPYFPILLWGLAISASVFYTLDKQIALVLNIYFYYHFCLEQGIILKPINSFLNYGILSGWNRYG